MEKLVKLIKELIFVKDKNEVLSVLSGHQDLSRDEKNLIYLYLFPRPLKDYGLPERIMENRVAHQNSLGWMQPELSEIGLLVEASQTQQYGRFMKHLMYSFIVDPGKIYNPTGIGFEKCCISGRILQCYNSWTNSCDKYDSSGKEFIEKNYLAFGSEETKVVLSLSALIQLKAATEFLELLDPDLLKWGKSRYSN